MVDWIIRKISANGCQKWILKKPYIIYVFLYMAKWKKKGSEWITRNISQVERLMAKKQISIQPIHWRTGHIELRQLPESYVVEVVKGPREVLTDLQELQRKMQGEYQTPINWVASAICQSRIRLPSRRHHLGTAGPLASRRCRCPWCFFSRRSQQKWYIQ